MRILFATNYGHTPDVVGGLQTSVDGLCRRLVHSGHDARLLCGYKGSAMEKTGLPRSDTGLGYQVIRMPDPVEALPAVCAEFNPDAVIVQSSNPMVPLLLASLEQGVPTSVYLHNIEFQHLGGILLPDPQILYLSNSRFTSVHMNRMFGIDSEVLFPLVEPSLYRTESSRENVLFVNPTMPKGVEIAFQVAARCPEIKFRMVESWLLSKTWRQHCQQRAQTLGNIEWMGPTHNMMDHFQTARVLLMPSLWEETYGRTATEAQVNGIPVLTSNRGALPETIGDGGVVIDAHAPTSHWENALRRMFQDQAYYDELSAQALAHVSRQSVDPEYICNRLIQLLEEHIKTHSTQ